MKDLSPELKGKLDALKEYIRDLGSLAVGFSAGVDSTFLLAVEREILGDKAIAVTTVHAAIPDRELSEAEDFCKEHGIRHFIYKFDPFQIEGFRKNSPDRCYHCKYGIFTGIKEIADEKGIEFLAEGSNIDDLGDYRPGLKALAELEIKSPLREAGLTKAEIRALSRELELPTWDKPSLACLATRIPCGDEVTEEKLRMIEQAEDFLFDLGFRQVRVRHHGDLARIEV